MITHAHYQSRSIHSTTYQKTVCSVSSVITIRLAEFLTISLTRASSLIRMQCLCPNNTHPCFCDQSPCALPELLLPLLFTLWNTINVYCTHVLWNAPENAKPISIVQKYCGRQKSSSPWATTLMWWGALCAQNAWRAMPVGGARRVGARWKVVPGPTCWGWQWGP